MNSGSEVVHMHSTMSCKHPREVLPDFYFCGGPEETDKEGQATAEKAVDLGSTSG